MKLLYITNGINGSGGLERVLSVKASLLAEQYAYKVHILVLNGAHINPFYEFSSSIRFHSVTAAGSPVSYFLNYKKGIQHAVDTIQPDIVSVCDDGVKGFFLPRLIKSKAKWIYERHVSKLIEARENDNVVAKMATVAKWKLMERLGKNFGRFIVLTEGNRKEWPSLHNVQVIANPLSFYPIQSAPLDNKVVICVGKISYQKGQDRLLKIWQSVHPRFPDWELHLYGKENMEFLNTDDLPANVRFFHPSKDIEQKYLDSALYLMSSRFEGFGMVLIEAMACGLPCVSFDCDYGPGDIITCHEDGYLVTNGDLKAFETAMIELMENTEKRKSFGVAAKENVQRYSAAAIVKQWDELFRSL